MNRLFFFPTAAATLAIALGGCSPGADNIADPASNAGTQQQANASAAAPPPAIQQNAIEASSPARSAAPHPRQIDLEGLGQLRIGQAVPRDTSWAERGAQTGPSCRTVSSPDYPGVYAIVAGDKVRRITVGQRSDVKLAGGIGAQSTERDVRGQFADFTAEPHKYEDAPAKYLTAPHAGNDRPALRFEIGSDGKVTMFHVGTMPELAYVEGCS